MTINITVSPNGCNAVVSTHHESSFTTEDGLASSSSYHNNRELVLDGTTKSFGLGSGGFTVNEVPKDVKTIAELDMPCEKTCVSDVSISEGRGFEYGRQVEPEAEDDGDVTVHPAT